MAFVSLIQQRTSFGNHYSTVANTIKIAVRFQKTAASKKSLALTIGREIVSNLGWLRKDRVVVKWDPDTRECIVRRAVKSDSCPSLSLQKSGNNLNIRMTWYEGMPHPPSKVEAHGIEIKDHEIFFEFPPECFDYLKG